jgi:hypothetical protein
MQSKLHLVVKSRRGARVGWVLPKDGCRSRVASKTQVPCCNFDVMFRCVSVFRPDLDCQARKPGVDSK